MQIPATQPQTHAIHRIKVVYLAIPSKGAFAQGEDHIWRPTVTLLHVLAMLRDQNPGVAFISPSMFNYAILPFLPASFKPTYESWKDECQAILNRCDSVLLLQLPDWKSSVGCKDEIMTAHDLVGGRPIRALPVDPGTTFKLDEFKLENIPSVTAEDLYPEEFLPRD